MDPYYNFELRPGYVESTRLGVIQARHDEGFVTLERAMEHLRLTLTSFLSSRPKPVKACCTKAPEKSRYCSECGTRLDTLKGVDPEDVADFFMTIPRMTLDDAGSTGLASHMEAAGWHLDGYHEDMPVVRVRAVGRWMARDATAGDRPYMEGTYPDGSEWNSRVRP